MSYEKKRYVIRELDKDGEYSSEQVSEQEFLTLTEITMAPPVDWCDLNA